LQAAAEEKLPKTLRLFFSHLLLCTEISDPLALWERFCDDLSEDFFHDVQNRDAALQSTLRSLQTTLEHSNKRLSDFGLPEPHGYTDAFFKKKEMRRETIAYDSSKERSGSLPPILLAYTLILLSTNPPLPCVALYPGSPEIDFLYAGPSQVRHSHTDPSCAHSFALVINITYILYAGLSQGRHFQTDL